MTADDATALVRSHTGTGEGGTGYRAELAGGTPAAWYVTADAGGQPLIGGTAYIVLVEAGRVFEVPASKPPHVNLREVRSQLAS